MKFLDVQEELFQEVQAGDLKALKAVVSRHCGANPSRQKQLVNEFTFMNNMTLLQVAAEKGHLDVACFLIDIGADINQQDENKMTALHYSAFGGFSEITKYLLQHGADPTLQNRWVCLLFTLY
jgi:hypothetical protein